MWQFAECWTAYRFVLPDKSKWNQARSDAA